MNRKCDDDRVHPDTPAKVRKGFVSTAHGQVHFLKAGQGPDVVLLHDSPRSSRLHIDTIHALSHRYTVYALDTPGYGMSDPLPIAQPTIEDFAAALDDALEALGLAAAPLYATHTSAKIAVEHASRTGKPRRLVLDGLSIPEKLADASFIDAYMRPFRIEPTGAYLAAEWQRIRDMLRWFPWFARSAATRMAMDRPDDAWIEQYTIDLFAAAGHYSDAYGAAMRYDPAPALRKLKVPTLVGARSNDVLFGYLDRVPVDDNPALSVDRLGNDTKQWLAWIERGLDGPDVPQVAPATLTSHDDAREYVDFGDGQILIHHTGPRGATPVLILEAPAPFTAFAWQEALAQRRHCVVAELPGYGQSDPLPTGADIGTLVESLLAVIAKLGGTVDVLGIGHASGIALALATAAGDALRMIVLDGAPGGDVVAAALCPHFPFSTAGSHIHESFHMMRDWQVQYPWFASSSSARRLTDPELNADMLHRCLLGILKQPRHYGDALALSQSVQLGAPTGPKGCDAMVFTLPDDPFYARAAEMAALLPGCTTRARAPGFNDAVKAVEEFLLPNR